MTTDAIRVLALMESTNVSGPAKNIIEFARRARTPGNGRPPVHLSLITYVRGAGDSEFVVAAREAGITTFTIRERRAFDTSGIAQLKDIVLESNPDILQSHNIKSHFYVRLNGLYKRYPWVVFNHGYTSIDLKDRAYAQFDRWSLRRAFRVVAVCGPFANRLIARGVKADCIKIQHNSVKCFNEPAPEQVIAVRQELGLTDELAIVCVGRLSTEKGHRDLLEAAAQLRRISDVPRFRLVLVGDGPEREQLTSDAARLGIAEICSFAGHRNDVRPWYRVASVFALPSRSEGSPNVVLEAMSAGVPVIATDVGGVPEIMQDGVTGLIVRSQEAPMMAEGLARLLRDESLRKRLGTAGRDHVGRDFTPEAYVSSLANFYKQVLADWRAR
jgi:glycosyltransferase involved in cell wall biosynthesis